MNDANLLYTDVETALQESVRDLLTDRCAPEKVIATYDGDRELQPKLWRSLALDLGLAGLLVPEERGGAGASAREAAAVLEELGRFAAPVPFLTSSVIATEALLRAGDDALLATVAGGERTAAVVVPFSTSPDELRATVRVDGQGALRGRVTSVAGAVDADVLLVPVEVADGVELHAVEAGAARITPVVSLDMTRQLADVDLDGASSTRVVEDGGDRAVRAALELGAALMASEQLGVAQWCLDTTVGYLRDRTQFGRSVGGFQALKHRLADLYVMTESTRTAARYAATTAADDDPDRHVAALMAKSYCSDSAVRAAEECVQLHGGIGMTWEHPAHLYLKRAKADQVALGNPQATRRRLGEVVDLPMPTT
ncbi:acyl-CoA dehydrogenase family protein [Halostreptopolyspora alba]|uniref:Acyl-CoA dehydrogenase n=1 Tax=Halostreptopolyspora alba TaxID=2487137 RepID=A0A3N0E4B5_9ACTN|nr:acyl-CoA dehydrogenase [Nocardiopsaceae bacterium YIM 96095]